MSILDGRDEYGSMEPPGFQPMHTAPDGDRFVLDVRVALLEELDEAVGAVSAEEQIWRPGAAFLISAVAGWYRYRYGLAPVNTAEYELEVTGVASLLAPHIADVPGDDHLAGLVIPYPSAAAVLGLGH